MHQQKQQIREIAQLMGGSGLAVRNKSASSNSTSRICAPTSVPIPAATVTVESAPTPATPHSDPLTSVPMISMTQTLSSSSLPPSSTAHQAATSTNQSGGPAATQLPSPVQLNVPSSHVALGAVTQRPTDMVPVYTTSSPTVPSPVNTLHNGHQPRGGPPNRVFRNIAGSAVPIQFLPSNHRPNMQVSTIVEYCFNCLGCFSTSNSNFNHHGILYFFTE